MVDVNRTFRSCCLARKYIYGPGIDRPVAMVNVSGVSETWYYYYADALGSIRLMSNAGGEIVESYAYDVFGRPRVMTVRTQYKSDVSDPSDKSDLSDDRAYGAYMLSRKAGDWRLENAAKRFHKANRTDGTVF